MVLTAVFSRLHAAEAPTKWRSNKGDAVGASQASNPQAQLGLAGSNNGSNLRIALYTVADDVALTTGRHQLRVGVWLQPFQSNEVIALSQYGQMTFTGLPNVLAGTASFLYDPAPTPMSWRSLFGA